MPISSASHASIEDILNRIATESILAQAGSVDGMVPAFSLLSDLADVCAPDPVIQHRVVLARSAIEARLDAAQPFDEATLQNLRDLVIWIPRALQQPTVDQTVHATPTTPSASAHANIAAAAEENHSPDDGDVMLALNLEENRELLVEFYAETVDHLQQIETALLALDHEPENPEALNSMFRSFHTIKGNAGFLGLVPMQTLAHEVESLLDLARNHQLQLNAAIITEILRSRDALQTLTQQVDAALHRGQLPNQIVAIGHLRAAVKVLATGSAPAVRLAPPLKRDPEPLSIAPSVGPGLAPVIPLSEAVLTATEMPQPRETAAKNVSRPGASPQTAAATVRVNTEKLDSLMDVVGELVIVQSQLLESSRVTSGTNAALQRNVAQLSRITKDLQSTAMALRMIPIKAAFQKMERLARDLARDFGKKVSFTTSGEDTELDRTVVEEIGDPLVHMVRNALDHGLEAPEQRVSAGKSDTGTLHLSAYHQGSNIVVELQDDGRGIDPDRIYRKAVEKGVIAAGASLSRDEILALIFAPGFSTAEKVTSVSGRGVGMDVVKRNIEKLRGKIEISSEVGRGSVFKIKLPLTMAIIDGLVVRVGADRFILPSTSVQMALRPARENISTVHGRGEVLDLRGRFVPIHRLNRCFGLQGDAVNPWDGIIVIVETSGKTTALLVDEMVSKQEVVIKNLGAFMQNLPGVSGGAILGDGNIALILDPGSLIPAAA